jgi:acid-sensing ion channel 5
LPFFPTTRFQTVAVARFGIVIFLWDMVSKVLHIQEIRINSTKPEEAAHFITSHQNFSITDFVKNNGFYLDNSTLLDCDFFGMPCGPKVMISNFSNIIKIMSYFLYTLRQNLIPWGINLN